ncbi:MAG: GNAT family N-acetyltransferase [Mycobacteriales bacterium]
MAETAVLTTERLAMREFRDTDREPFAVINSDPVVMEHFVKPQTPEESGAFVDRIRAQWQAEGWGLWALERSDTGEFIGYAGLWPVRFEARIGEALALRRRSIDLLGCGLVVAQSLSEVAGRLTFEAPKGVTRWRR